MKTLLFLAVCLIGQVGAVLGAVEVSALHPLMADLARQVGGERVRVFDLVGEGGNPHHFEPKPSDLKRMASSAVILASGKGMEPYLDRIHQSLGGVTVVEVGRTIPSLQVGKDQVYTCCPHHGHGTVDPHWWHGVDNMRRAARVVANALAEKDPAGKEFYLANAANFGRRMVDLKKWAKSELAKVPRTQRKLVTAHNAFGYFANEFGFQVIAVAGLTKEQNNAPKEQARTIESIRKTGVRAVFPEYGGSDRAVRAIAAATGVAVAEPLIADGDGQGSKAGFEAMIRHNVAAITRALAGS